MFLGVPEVEMVGVVAAEIGEVLDEVGDYIFVSRAQQGADFNFEVDLVFEQVKEAGIQCHKVGEEQLLGGDMGVGMEGRMNDAHDGVTMGEVRVLMGLGHVVLGADHGEDPGLLLRAGLLLVPELEVEVGVVAHESDLLVSVLDEGVQFLHVFIILFPHHYDAISIYVITISILHTNAHPYILIIGQTTFIK